MMMPEPFRVVGLLGLPLWKGASIRRVFFNSFFKALPERYAFAEYSDFTLFSCAVIEMVAYGKPPHAFLTDGYALKDGETKPIFEDLDAAIRDKCGISLSKIEELDSSGIPILNEYPVYMCITDACPDSFLSRR